MRVLDAMSAWCLTISDLVTGLANGTIRATPPPPPSPPSSRARRARRALAEAAAADLAAPAAAPQEHLLELELRAAATTPPLFFPESPPLFLDSPQAWQSASPPPSPLIEAEAEAAATQTLRALAAEPSMPPPSMPPSPLLLALPPLSFPRPQPTCDVCGRAFAFPRDRDRHAATHKSTPDMLWCVLFSFSCLTCSSLIL